METYSKALNAGQYPLSVLAVNERAAGLYRKGVYGNTMTSQPARDGCRVRRARAADAGTARQHPRARPGIPRQAQRSSRTNCRGLITKVQGTGLLFSCELDPSFKCYGTGSTEEFMRERGFGVIHGGINSLRFTPHFAITSEEVDLMIAHVRHGLLAGPRKTQAAAA